MCTNLFVDSIKILRNKKGNKLRKIVLQTYAESDEILKEKLRESFDKQIQILEEFFENYPENKIDKYLVLGKIILMDVEVERETLDNIIEEMEKLSNRVNK